MTTVKDPSELYYQYNCTQWANLTSFFGLNFTVLCKADLYGADLEAVNANTLGECYGSCTSRWGCYGATWAGGRCYRKNITVYDLSPIPKPDAISFVAQKSQLSQTDQDIACPYSNLAEHETHSGLKFKIQCGAMYWGDDMYELSREAYQFMHADNLTHCVNNCADHHPLCKRVTYDSDKRSNLWLNCWLKNKTEAKIAPTVGGMHHSAHALIPTLTRGKCQNDSTITASDGRIFRISCMDRRSMPTSKNGSIVATHQDSIENCVDQCGSPGANCSSVAFDLSLESGYRNCYLFNSIPPPMEHNDMYTFVYLDALSGQFRASPFEPPDPSFQAKLAAEITVPCVVALALFTIVWFWRRRRRNRRYTPVKTE